MMMVRPSPSPSPSPNHDRSFEGGCGGGGGGGGYGPTTVSGGGAEDNHNIYDVSGGGGTVVVRTTTPVLQQQQQPFDISTTSNPPPAHTFKSPVAVAGGMMMMGASSLGGFPFTSAQWKELERQAMIYKYMTASLPVPPELLIPITRNLSDSASSPHLGRSVFNLRFSNGGADPEPGRCRRTDGKKWRCSKDVAPNQKYCERHMHRGRPRSRKPVEVVHAAVDGSSHKKIRHCHAPTPPPPPPPPILSNHLCSQSQFLGSAGLDPYLQDSVFLYKSDHKSPPPCSPLIVSVPPFKETRSLEWAGKGGASSMSASEQQWQQLMQTKIGLTLDSSSTSICDSSSSVFNHHYQEQPINLNTYTDISAGADHPGRDSCNMFLNPEAAASLKNRQTETPRTFIDAWSSSVTENPPNTCNNRSSVSSGGKLPLSSLTLSMGGGNGIIENEMSCSRIATVTGDKPQLSTWLTPAAWAAGSAPGGPLAEVLRPSSTSASAAAPSNPGSPRGGNGNSVSPSETAASSPSGVLHKPLVSPSDSSGNSSPTHLSASPTKPEIAFPWMNQSKQTSSAV